MMRSPTLADRFSIEGSRSRGFESYPPGPIPFISNGFDNNGILGFIEPRSGDRIFQGRHIVLSAFCEATVHEGPFVARGNGGSGLLVLTPYEPMSMVELAAYAAYINSNLRWRFSWSRMVTRDRICGLSLPQTLPAVKYAPWKLLPANRPNSNIVPPLRLATFSLGDLFDMEAGHYHSTAALPAGDIPLVSCADAANGVVTHVDVPLEFTQSHLLTIAFNGMNTLTSKFHPYRFGAKDDVALCVPKVPMNAEMLFLAQTMVNRERWRYSYYRKCFMEKLRRVKIQLPSKKAGLDLDAASNWIHSATSYWASLAPHYAKAKGIVSDVHNLPSNSGGVVVGLRGNKIHD